MESNEQRLTVSLSVMDEERGELFSLLMVVDPDEVIFPGSVTPGVASVLQCIATQCGLTVEGYDDLSVAGYDE
jgi:hypothetical protein